MHDRILLGHSFDFADFRITRKQTGTWHVSPRLAAAVDRIWAADVARLTQMGVHIWDGDPYRVEHPECLLQVQPDEPIPLTIAPIKYRWIHAFGQLAKEFLADPRSHNNHFSVGGPIVTSDGWYVLGERSGKTTSTHPHDFIGGGINEDEIVVNTGEDVKRVHFDELLEEANIQAQDVLATHGLGIVQAQSTAILVFFLTELRITRAQLEAQFPHRTDPEMSDLVFIAQEEFVPYLTQLGEYHALVGELLTKWANSSGS